MPKPLFIIIGLLTYAIAPSAQTLTIYKSEGGVEKTVQKLIEIIKLDDHLVHKKTISFDMISREQGVALDSTWCIGFLETELVPKLLQCQPTAAYDLPLEIIVWKEYGDVYFGFIDPKFMKRRFMITGCDEVIEQLSGVLTRVSMDALRQL